MKRYLQLGVIVFFTLFIVGGVYYYKQSQQPKNIFDEMYGEVQSTYQTNNILRKIKGFEIRAAWPSDNELTRSRPFGSYSDRSLPNGYSLILVSFFFDGKDKGLSIISERDLDKNVKLQERIIYHKKSHLLIKKVNILQSGVLITDRKKINHYLKQYQITYDDLNRYYKQIIDDKLLNDWCKVYKSKYAPNNYGQVTLNEHWEYGR